MLPLPLACKVSAEKSAETPIGFPLYVISCFSLPSPWILIDIADLLHQPKPISRPLVKWEANDKTFYLNHFEFECAVPYIRN